MITIIRKYNNKKLALLGITIELLAKKRER